MALNESQLSRLRRTLDQAHESLLEQVRDALERSEDHQYVEIVGRVPVDTGEEAAGDALADIKLAMIDRYVNEIRDIDAALQRIQAGSFGICADCGQPVAFDRLLAYPTAKRCVICQGQREKLYAGESASHRL